MLTENSSGQNLGGFRYASVEPFESVIWNFETLLQNFISTAIISPNVKTIRPLVTENLYGQNLSGKKKKKKDDDYDDDNDEE